MHLNNCVFKFLKVRDNFIRDMLTYMPSVEAVYKGFVVTLYSSIHIQKTEAKQFGKTMVKRKIA